MDAVFRIAGNRVLTSPLAAGPWNSSLQHGAAPAALVAWVAEGVPCERPMQVARITIDLLRPVPIAPLELKIELLRQGRKIQLCGIQPFAEGVEVVRASVLRVRMGESALSEPAGEELLDMPLPERGRDPGLAEPRRFSYRRLDERSCGRPTSARPLRCVVPRRSSSHRGGTDFPCHARCDRFGFLQRCLCNCRF